MIMSLRHLLGWVISAFSSRESLILENLALRQQVLALHGKRPRRRLTALHKLFWVVLRTLWSGWERPLILVAPRTVVGWHRAGFRLYWTWVSRVRRIGGRRPVSKEVRALIFRIAAENPTWGAPRIHGELLKLGFQLSETTVSRWLRRIPRTPDPAKRWLAFLRNHREAIAAMDFFTVPTLTFGILYCFFVIGHDRRKILRFNVTRNPSAPWIVQQMREAWPYMPTHRFLLFDRDSKFGTDVISAAKDVGSQPIRTAFRSPWQNGVAERWVGSCRRDLLDHVIVLKERHLKRLWSSNRATSGTHRRRELARRFFLLHWRIVRPRRASPSLASSSSRFASSLNLYSNNSTPPASHTWPTVPRQRKWDSLRP
jgi:putative transposase